MNPAPPPEASPRVVPPALPSRRFPWRPFLLGGAILLCGMVIGAGATLLFLQKRVARALQHPELAAQRAVARLKAPLRLTPGQSDRIEAVFSRRLDAMNGIRLEIQPRIREEIRLLREEVARELPERQAEAWRKRSRSLDRLAPAPAASKPVDGAPRQKDRPRPVDRPRQP